MKRRLWLWFIVGTVATFLLLALSLNIYAMLPSGQGVTSIKLWRYYVNEWPKAFGSHSIGPTSSNQDNLLSTTFQHIALSAVGGAVLAAVVWGIQRYTGKSA